MLFTAAAGDGAMHLGLAESADGYGFTARPEPFLSPSPDWHDFDHGAVDDPRITRLDGRWYITYAARSWNLKVYGEGHYRLGPGGNRHPTWSRNFRRTGLAVTNDWQTVERLGPLSSEHLCDANVVLFPEKIGGKYVYLHRPTLAMAWTLPMFYNPGCIWLVFCDRVDHWSSNRREMPWDMDQRPGRDLPDDWLLARPEREWEKMKIGGSGVPIPTDDGWLMFYHAVDMAGIYRVGLMLLDRADPRRVLCRTAEPVMEPVGFEREGSYPGCIFPCANVVLGDDIYLYYGAGDGRICMANLSLKSALEHVKKYKV